MALRESQKENSFLADLLNRSEQPFGVGYPEGRLGIVNGAFERLTGYSAAELRTMDWATVLTPPEWQESERRSLEELNRNGRPVHYEKEYLRKDGSRVPIELLVHLVKDSSGNTLHYYSFITDITERKKAEKALRESEERFRTIAEMSPVQLSIARRADGRLLFTNPAYDRAFGFGPGELTGHKTPDLYYHHSDREVVLDIFRTAGSVEAHEVQVKRKDGSPFWVNLSLRAIRFSGEDATIAATIDITGRKAAESVLEQKNENLNALNEELTATQEELHQNLEELSRKEAILHDLAEQRQLALDASGMGWWRYDPVTKISSYDQRYREIFRVTGEQSPNDEILANRMHPDDLPEVWRRVERALDPIDPQPYSAMYRINLTDGTIKWIEAHGIASFQGTGKDRRATSLVGTVADITERRNADENLKEKNENLIALNEELTATEEELHRNLEELSLREEELSKALAEKEILLSEIHHRVKNNLTAFISLLSLEGSTEDTPAGKMLKQDLQNRARSMALVHETLYRTRLFHDVDMEMYLTTLLNQIGGSFGTTRAVKIVVDAHGVMLDIPRATPAGLIANEIVTNSFKYAFPDSFDVQGNRNAPPTISLTLTKTNGEYEMIIRDNGVGLPEGVDVARTKTLGLKLVNFLAKHQMRAEVEVKNDNGTVFIFRFSD
jgi:PAS domain S-box-containing protein